MKTVIRNTCVVLIAVLNRNACVQGQYQPVFDNTRVLTSGDLSVEVMDPLSPTRQDRSVRFSPLAFVIQINYQGINYLYAPPGVTDMIWYDTKEEYPAGAPMEFDLGDYEISPPGFDTTCRDASPSDKEFIKIGVGILENNRGGALQNEYFFAHDYPLAESTKNSVVWRADGATFVQTLPRVSDSGYRYELETELNVEGKELRIDYRLTNCGKKPFTTSQYLHNFTRINDRAVGPGYEVEVPWPFTVTNLMSGQPVAQRGKSIFFQGPVTIGHKLAIPIDHIGDSQYVMAVRQTEANLGILSSAELPPEKTGAKAEPLGVAVWSTDSTQLSPEQFVRIELDPGHSIQWTRTYRFNSGPKGESLSER